MDQIRFKSATNRLDQIKLGQVKSAMPIDQIRLDWVQVESPMHRLDQTRSGQVKSATHRLDQIGVGLRLLSIDQIRLDWVRLSLLPQGHNCGINFCLHQPSKFPFMIFPKRAFLNNYRNILCHPSNFLFWYFQKRNFSTKYAYVSHQNFFIW